ncbi:MAG TPA: M67 family metallopeptidase [Roseiflexaceae bacterium]|nr:M67 family metallopeptidase [Roseiflexaceae bacterium]
MIVVSDNVRRAIAAHAEQAYPNECVGLLLGRYEAGRKVAEEVFAAQNTWTAEVGLTDAEEQHSQRDRFYLDPRDYLRADRQAQARGLDIVGCYHSHPDHPAVPSERDRVGAQGVGAGSLFSFLIQCVHGGRAAELTAWLLADEGNRFVSEELR